MLDALDQIELLRALDEGEAQAKATAPNVALRNGDTGDIRRNRAERILRALERAGFTVARTR